MTPPRSASGASAGIYESARLVTSGHSRSSPADADAVTDELTWASEPTAQHSEGTVTLLRGAPCHTTAIRIDPLARPACWLRKSALQAEADSAAVGPLVESPWTCGLWGYPQCSDAAHPELRLVLLWTLTLTVTTVAVLLP